MIIDTLKDTSKNRNDRRHLSRQTLQNHGVDIQHAVAVIAIGDAMQPTINHHSIVYVDLGRRQIKDNKVFAIEHSGVFQFRRLYALPLGGVRVVSDNSECYAEHCLTAQDMIEQEFRVIGWAFNWQTMDCW